MNKQRKVLITITYNELGIIVDAKAEEIDLSAQPERKTGKWDDIGGIIRWGCPICHHAYETKYNFCPKCGADMRGEQDE